MNGEKFIQRNHGTNGVKLKAIIAARLEADSRLLDCIFDITSNVLRVQICLLSQLLTTALILQPLYGLLVVVVKILCLVHNGKSDP